VTPDASWVGSMPEAYDREGPIEQAMSAYVVTAL
jgi:hypothetical protein